MNVVIDEYWQTPTCTSADAAFCALSCAAIALAAFNSSGICHLESFVTLL